MFGIRKGIRNPLLCFMAIALIIGGLVAFSSDLPAGTAGAQVEMLSLEGGTQIAMVESPAPAELPPAPLPATFLALYVVAALLVAGVATLVIVSRQIHEDTRTGAANLPTKGRMRYPRDGVRPAPLGA